jgi:anhydro-N-acetylmuramic acid kinase
MDQSGRLIAGAMSGTSADGVDVAIVHIAGRGVAMSAKLVYHHHRDYSAELKQKIFAMRGEGKVALAELAHVGREISRCYATAVNEAIKGAGISAKDLAAVAAHGQTLCHDPPTTIQWFDPSIVAAEVGCAVVSDFRRADCAAGGQGAPLVPFADYILFRDEEKNRVLLNIGGIANITYLKAGGTLEEVIAFDTGPGNCISDWLCRTRGSLGMSYDVDGMGAMRGRVNDLIVDEFARHGFIARSAPKSTDGPEMIQGFEQAIRKTNAHKTDLNDLLATAAYVTASAIAGAINSLEKVDELLASGGGVHNKAMMSWLKSMLGAVELRTAEEFAINGDAKEAVAFALLGAATLDSEPSNVPSVTGAKRAVVLGSITPKP